MKKRYICGNFFKQVLLANIVGVNIVGFKKILDRNREIIEFEFDEDNEAVNELLDNYRIMSKYNGVEIEGFAEMKKKRRELIREYLKECKNETLKGHITVGDCPDNWK